MSAIVIIKAFKSLKIDLKIALQFTSNYSLSNSQILSYSPYMLYTFSPSLSPHAFLDTHPLVPTEIYTSSMSALITVAKHMSILNSLNPLAVHLWWDSTLPVYYYAQVLFSQLKYKVVNSRIQGFSNFCVSNNVSSIGIRLLKSACKLNDTAFKILILTLGFYLQPNQTSVEVKYRLSNLQRF